MKKKKIIAVFLSMVLFLVGCSGENTEKEEDKKTVTAANNSDYIHLTMIKPQTINPLLNSSKSVSYIMNLVYDGLFEIDENYNVEQKLAKDYELSSDGKTMTINLVEDAKWHNGDDVTASDVQYSINLIKNNKTSSYYNLIQNISNVTITGTKSLKLTFKENYSFSVYTLIFPIVSKNQLSSIKGDNLTLAKNNLNGNGPYKIKEYEEREYILLEPNDEYYEELGENTKDIYVMMVPDTESQKEMVLSLDSDIASISLGDLSEFLDNDAFNITSYESRGYEYGIFNYDNEYLQDLNIRKVIAFSLDRERILKEGYSTRIAYTTFPLSLTSNYYNSELKPLSYNTDNSQNYLKKAVLSLSKASNATDEEKSQEQDTTKDNATQQEETTEQEEEQATEQEQADTTKEDNRSFKEVTKQEVKDMLSKVNFKIIVNKDNTERIKTANIISENLKSIGIKSTISALTTDEMTTALDSKEYDIALIGAELSSIPDATNLINNTGFADTKLTKYMDSLKSSTNDETTKEIYTSIQEYTIQNVAFISFGLLEDYTVINNRLNGKLSPNDFNIYKGISNIELK